MSQYRLARTAANGSGITFAVAGGGEVSLFAAPLNEWPAVAAAS